MHALTTTRQLLQEVRDLREREDVPQQPEQPKQSKRRRMEDIKSQAMENVLTGIVEANIEMHGIDFELGLKWNRTGPSNEWQLPGFKIVHVFD